MSNCETLEDAFNKITKVRNELKNIRQAQRSLLSDYKNSVERALLECKREILRKNDDDNSHNNFSTGESKNENNAFKIIGHIESMYKNKNGTPRQGTICQTQSSKLVINKELFNNPEHTLDGLEMYSHIWIIFTFHKNEKEFSGAKVHPPRLNGKSMGVFATRSPYRPNPIGLTLAKIEKIERHTIHLMNTDLIDGTPVLDIKPYIPNYDYPILSNTLQPPPPTRTPTISPTTMPNPSSKSSLGILSEMASIAMTSTPMTSTPMTSTPMTSTPMTSTPMTSTPMTSTPMTSTPMTSTPMTSTAMISTPMISTPTTSSTTSSTATASTMSSKTSTSLATTSISSTITTTTMTSATTTIKPATAPTTLSIISEYSKATDPYQRYADKINTRNLDSTLINIQNPHYLEDISEINDQPNDDHYKGNKGVLNEGIRTAAWINSATIEGNLHVRFTQHAEKQIQSLSRFTDVNFTKINDTEDHIDNDRAIPTLSTIKSTVHTGDGATKRENTTYYSAVTNEFNYNIIKTDNNNDGDSDNIKMNNNSRRKSCINDDGDDNPAVNDNSSSSSPLSPLLIQSSGTTTPGNSYNHHHHHIHHRHRNHFLKDVTSIRKSIVEILSADPRSAYRRKHCKDRLYYFIIDDIHITCWFNDCGDVINDNGGCHGDGVANGDGVNNEIDDGHDGTTGKRVSLVAGMERTGGLGYTGKTGASLNKTSGTLNRCKYVEVLRVVDVVQL